MRQGLLAKPGETRATRHGTLPTMFATRLVTPPEMLVTPFVTRHGIEIPSTPVPAFVLKALPPLVDAEITAEPIWEFGSTGPVAIV
jgi:hypothetical protein